jgi:putative endonuclease
MFKVYLLRSLSKPAKTYIGQTIKPIEVRVAEHNTGLSRSTKSFMPWELIYYENFYCQNCTDKREKFLKSGLGYRLRKIILENYKKLV